MSIQAINWAFEQNVESSSCKFILVCLANYANEASEAYPSVETISRMTGLDRKTVFSGLSKLSQSGYITDTKKRVGATKCIPVYKLSQKRNSSENGAVPKTAGNSPVFAAKQSRFSVKQSQKRDTEPLGTGRNHQGNPPVFRSKLLKQLEEARAEKNRLFAAHAIENSLEGTKWRSAEYKAKWERWRGVEKACLEKLPDAI